MKVMSYKDVVDINKQKLEIIDELKKNDRFRFNLLLSQATMREESLLAELKRKVVEKYCRKCPFKVDYTCAFKCYER